MTISLDLAPNTFRIPISLRLYSVSNIVKQNTPKMLKEWKKGKTIMELSDKYKFPPILTAMFIFLEDGATRKEFWDFVNEPDVLNEETEAVCNNLTAMMNALRTLDVTDRDAVAAFREQYKAQDWLCLEHYALVMENVNKKVMDKPTLAQFYEATNALSKGYMNTLYDDVTHFASMFDYRNKGGDYKNSKDAIERSVSFITSYSVDINLK